MNLNLQIWVIVEAVRGFYKKSLGNYTTPLFFYTVIYV